MENDNMPQLSDKKLQQIIKFNPHPGQKEVLKALRQGKREIVIAAGRRWGKSLLAAYIVLRYLLVPDKRIWIVAPTYELTQKIFDYLTKWIREHFPALIPGILSKPTPRVITPDDSFCICKSTESPDSLLGEELDLVIMDEAARIKKEIDDGYIYPCLTSRKGKIIRISTPLGHNWFYHQWLKAADSPDGAAFQFPTHTNPYISKEEIERAKEKLPERIFRQEYLATFEAESTSIFRNVEECIQGELEDAVPGRQYILGVDLGKFYDFTVFIVVDKMRRHVVYFERFKNLDWEFQKTRLKAVALRYNGARICIDAEGKGDPLVDELENEGFIVDAYRIKSNEAKRRLIEKLSMFLDSKKITYPPIEPLINELKSYTFKISPTGKIQYTAPAGLHDDCVTALALAVWPLSGREEDLTPIQKEIRRIQRSQQKLLRSRQYR